MLDWSPNLKLYSFLPQQRSHVPFPMSDNADADNNDESENSDVFDEDDGLLFYSDQDYIENIGSVDDHIHNTGVG
eukprot:Awhi_evm1s1633